jgi:hypothetical protein
MISSFRRNRRELILVGHVVLQGEVVSRQSRTGNIGLGIPLQQLDGDRVQPVPRNLIAGERLARLGIDDRHARLREISIAHRHARRAEYDLLLVAEPEPFVVGHEEQLVRAVEQLRNRNRSAQRKAVLIPLERRCLGLDSGELIGRRVERVVADELEDRPVIRVRAALGRDVDLCDLAPEFRRIHTGLHLEFLDAVDRGQKRVRVEVDVLIDDAVERVLVVFATLPGDREILRRAVATLSAAGSAASTTCVV